MFATGSDSKQSWNCDAYWKHQGKDLPVLFELIQSSCNCYDPFIECRELNVVASSPPSTWDLQFTCTQKATADCKASVQEYFKVWTKAPPKDDNCYGWYIGAERFATSCH